jgi:hypothetical protein
MWIKGGRPLAPSGTHVDKGWGPMRSSSPPKSIGERGPLAVFGKNRRVTLIKDENDVPVIDDILAPSARIADSFQADIASSRGL